jgi:capsular exopolysaccharide synthesis family protein
VSYGRAVREIESNKKLFTLLKEKLEEARIAEAEKVSDISVVDPAVLPTSPVEPNKQMGLLIGAVLGLIIGIALAFFFETIDPSIGTIEDVENVIMLPVLGVVPSIQAEIESESKRGWWEDMKKQIIELSGHRPPHDKEMDRYLRLFVHHKPNSLVAEAFRNIQANLKIHPDRNKIFLVTSSGPGEGKTTTLINLGLTCAQSGLKTLLVSSDLRRPAVAKAFGLKRESGLREYLEGMLDYSGLVRNVSDLVLGEMGFEEILKFPGIENISIISSGSLPSNPAAALISRRLKDLTQEVRRDFDVIFFDSPPVLPIADATILAPSVDSVILVYEIGKTARQALMRTKVQVESTGARISGVVLNNIKPRTESTMFSYPYYYRYKYSEDKDADREKSASSNDEHKKGASEA